jgi:CRISPR-associated exonuclease Cas4
MNLAVLAVLLLVLVCVILAHAHLGRRTQLERRELGLTRGKIVAPDDSRQPAPTLFSARLGLVGRPDHLLRTGADLIPVEQKPSARRAQPSHVMQLATQCILVEEVFGRRPPYGILVLERGVQIRVPFTLELERRVLATASEMRELLCSGDEPERISSAAKCRACGFRSHCWPGL